MKAEIKPRINLDGRTRLETVIPLSTPYLVFLDPSDICNSKCPWCPTGSGEALKYKKPQLMDYILYRKIIDDLAIMPEPIKTLRLYSDGEPLLNPWFPDMVKYAKNTGRFGQIDTTTKGNLLDSETTRRIVDVGLDKIFISVPQTYNSQYVEKIAYLHGYSFDQCKVYVKIIGDGMNLDEQAKFMSDFNNFSDRIFIEHIAPCWPGYKVKDVNKEVGIYGQPIKEVQVCSYIFYSLKINSDGTVSLCFLDWKHDMILGDLKKESFKDIWNGKLLRDYRIMHLAEGRKLIRGCQNCGQLSYGAPDDIDPYAQEILRRIE
jgi:radical SAM protein with 4Fe4S-binding SPASM domain